MEANYTLTHEVGIFQKTFNAICPSDTTHQVPKTLTVFPSDRHTSTHTTTPTMKISASILVLVALQPVAAFVTPTPKAFRTALYSAPPPPPPGAPPGPAGGGAVPNAGVSQQRSAPGGPGSPLSTASKPVQGMQAVKDIWDSQSVVKVQGGSLRTWSFASPKIETVQVLLRTDGRPLNANIELWQGPDNTPQKMGVYIEDGSIRPYSCMIATPRDSNAIAVYNTAPLEYPLDACVEAGDSPATLGDLTKALAERGRVVQGGAVYTTPFDSTVESVQILLETDGRPLNARVELLQGPNNQKQVMEIYTEDGIERPFFAVLDTPGVGNVIRIVNTATVEFPLAASVEPYLVQQG